MKTAVIIVLIFSIVLGFLFWKYSPQLLKKGEDPNKSISLTYWGLWEDESAFRPVIEAYQKLHPNIKITYVKQNPLNYWTRLQTQIRAGQGPDIFRIHSSWLPMFMYDLAPALPGTIDINQYTQAFYPVAKDTLTQGGKIYAVPLEIDGLGMYVNTDILKGVNVNIPKTWQEFVEAARKTTVKNQQGQIQTAGASLGTTENIDYWPEILGLLFLQQPQTDLNSPAMGGGSDVLQFYTGFVTDPRNKTWDVNLPASTKMFAEGKVAFYFAPARAAQNIRDLNPNLQFQVAPVPQLPGKQVSWGSFWAEGVSIASLNQKAAWDFLEFLSSPQALQLLYQQQISTQVVARPFPRTDMADLISSDPILGAFITQGPYYKSWYLNTTFQEGDIDGEIKDLYKIAINGVLQGQDPLASLQVTAGGIKKVIDKYSRPPVVPSATK